MALGLGQDDFSWLCRLVYLHARHELVIAVEREDTLFKSRGCTTEASTNAKMPRTMHNRRIVNFMIDWQPRCNS